MGQKGIVFTSQLPTRDLAHLFREATQAARGANAKVASLTSRMTSTGKADDYFTPTFDSPFAAVDGVPDFAIGVVILKFSGGAKGNGTPIHMYVQDEGDHREVQLVSSHGLTGGPRSARVTRKVFQGFSENDPSIDVLEGNILNEA